MIFVTIHRVYTAFASMVREDTRAPVTPDTLEQTVIEVLSSRDHFRTNEQRNEKICCCFCICENKGPDQLHSNGAADPRLCFNYKE